MGKRDEDHYKRMTMFMGDQLNKMRIELRKVKEQQRTDPNLQRQRRWHRPSLILRMQNELKTKETLLEKTNKAKQQAKLSLKSIKKSGKKKEKKLALLRRKTSRLRIVEEERLRLKIQNEELRKKSAEAEIKLNEKNFGEEGITPMNLAMPGGQSIIPLISPHSTVMPGA